MKSHHKAFIQAEMVALSKYDDKRPSTRLNNFVEHSERVAQSMKLLAKQRGYDDHMAEMLYWATKPHDIGKRMLPVYIWDYSEKDASGKSLKPPEDLKELRRQHAIFTKQIIRNHFGSECDTDPFLKLMIDIGENHHEFIDGSGYRGKMQNELSQEVQMAIICDSFDGWTIPWPHKKPEELTPLYIINKKMSDGRFNMDILKSFKEIVPCLSNYSSLSPSY